MYYIGLMSGTSADGVDAVAVSIRNDREFALLATHQHPFSPRTREEIEALGADCRSAGARPGSLRRLGELDVTLGRLFAGAAAEVLAKAGLAPAAVRAIGSHGQTVCHCPDARHPFSLQIGDPSVIAEITGITTVADFRARDIAAGGQGAPLVPAFHRYLFHSPARNRVIVNIGGIANVTFLSADVSRPVLGFDTGPGNCLLDQWIQLHLSQPYDGDGKWAATGTRSDALLERLLADPYFGTAPPKSTGKEYFNLEWLRGHLRYLRHTPPAEDVQATLTQLTASTIADALHTFVPPVDEVYLCGGGAHNSRLVDALADALPHLPLAGTQVLGVHPDWVEAAAFAWLAHQALEGRPGNVPSVTGAKHAVILGGIYKS